MSQAIRSSATADHNRHLRVTFKHYNQHFTVLRTILFGECTTSNKKCGRKRITQRTIRSDNTYARNALRRPSRSRVDDVTESSSTMIEKLFFVSACGKCAIAKS